MLLLISAQIWFVSVIFYFLYQISSHESAIFLFKNNISICEHDN